MKETKSNQKGFTLIELLVVIAIIGLLASVVLLSLNSVRSKSRDAKRVSDVKAITTALELYYSDCGLYPTTAATISAVRGLYATPVAGTCAAANSGFLATSPNQPTTITYVARISPAPTPPDNPGTSNACTAGAAGTNQYRYTPVNAGASYTLQFCIGGASGSLTAGTVTADPNGLRQP